jgi:tetratricopeptide (TPR) repeat protein
MAEHQRERMGLCAESAALSREILASVAAGHPNYQPVVGALAQLSLGAALLCELRTTEARRELLPLQDGVAEVPWLGARAHLLLGRSLEWEGDRAGASGHYRLAADAEAGDDSRRARDALRDPLSREAAQALALVAEARRLREDGQPEASAAAYRRAHAAWPENREAALRVAEHDLEHGRVRAARAALEELVAQRSLDPPWLRPWAWLLLGHAHDLAGERSAALEAYRRVWEAPLGRAPLKQAAAAGLEAPYAARPALPNH